MSISSLLLGGVGGATATVSANTHSIDLEQSSSQYLSISDASQTGLDITGDITIEAWVKLESDPFGSGVNWIIASKRPADNSNFYNFYIPGGTHQLQLRLKNGGTTDNGLVVSWTPSTAVWYHVAVTWAAATGTAKFYVDGSQQGSDVVGALRSNANNTGTFCIGAEPAVGGDYFDGLIDDVRIWNVVRTSTEINNNKGVEIDSATNLQGSWHLNNALTDASGNGNTLTNNNAATFSTDHAF